MQDLAYAVKEKVVEDHNVIDEAIREEAEVRAPLLHWGIFLCRMQTLTNMLCRATQSSPSPLVSCTGQTRQRSATSRPKITSARQGLSLPLTGRTHSLVLLAPKSET